MLLCVLSGMAGLRYDASVGVAVVRGMAILRWGHGQVERRRMNLQIPRALARVIVHDLANLLTGDPQVRALEVMERAAPEQERAPATEPEPVRQKRSVITAEMVAEVWTRWAAGEAPLHELAAPHGVSSTTLGKRFAKLHGAALCNAVGDAYRRFRHRPHEVRARLIGNVVSAHGGRAPVLKRRGQIL